MIYLILLLKLGRHLEYSVGISRHGRPGYETDIHHHQASSSLKTEHRECKHRRGKPPGRLRAPSCGCTGTPHAATADFLEELRYVFSALPGGISSARPNRASVARVLCSAQPGRRMRKPRRESATTVDPRASPEMRPPILRRTLFVT